MLLTTLLAGAALAAGPAVPADGTYKGTTTTDHQAVRIVVVDGRVQTAFATVRHYRCDKFGNVGPVAVAVMPNAPVTARKFSFDGGRAPSYLKMYGTFSARTTGRTRNTVTGSLRAYGTIATGQTCTSPRRAFTLRRVVRS